MSLYNLPEFNTLKVKKTIKGIFNKKNMKSIFSSLVQKRKISFSFSLSLENKIIFSALLAFIIFFAVSFGMGYQVKSFLQGVENENVIENQYIPQVSYEQAIINSVKTASPSVVSIIIKKNLPVYEQQWINPFGDIPGFNFQVPQNVQKGTELKEVGSGSGFIVSEDGLILTNKHVVLDKKAEYTVFTNDGKKFSAKVLALNPVQDLAIIKIESDNLTNSGQAKKFKAIKLGDSLKIQIGQGAIAIGNALGEFRNTVSVGVISGLGRTIAASGQGGFSEILEDIIQTDAAINSGNSGGPLLNLKGEVIGINTAMAQGAETIGFAIPINRAKRDIEQVSKGNKITYPFLGVRYILINEQVKEKNNLSVDYGAWVKKGNSGESAVTKNSAADKAGIKSEDIILEFNGEKITANNSMATIITKYNPGDKATLKVLRGTEELNIDVILGEKSE